MVYIILYLVGGLLFVNGLFLIGIATNLAGVAAFNFLGGTLITIMALYIAGKDMYSAFGETVSNVVAATCLTFSIAYLMIALEGFSIVAGLKIGGDFTTLGWYCLPMSICLFCLFLGWLQVIGSKMPKVPQFAFLWLCWSICFFLFFLALAAKMPVGKLTGWFIMIVGFITCSYPALANFQAGKVGQW
jgi:putative amide transporter protein